MMKLRISNASPYARKCLVVAIEAGIDDRIEPVPTAPFDPASDLPRDNPLGKIPVLVTDGGESLYDSPVICEYLDSLHGGRRLVPAAGGERWAQLRLHALGDGILDAAVAMRIETSLRPEDKRWPQWIERQQAAIARALDVLEAECGDWGGDFLIGQIAVAAALGYLDFRIGREWRAARPQLAAWFAEASGRRSMAASEPKD
jgi:glutathione S-transferase